MTSGWHDDEMKSWRNLHAAWTYWESCTFSLAHSCVQAPSEWSHYSCSAGFHSSIRKQLSSHTNPYYYSPSFSSVLWCKWDKIIRQNLDISCVAHHSSTLVKKQKKQKKKNENQMNMGLTFLQAGHKPFSSVRIRCQQNLQIWNDLMKNLHLGSSNNWDSDKRSSP